MAQSTKGLLFRSFKELIEVESVSKITITDITDRVGVNRHTFYYHFKDVNGLVTWGFEAAIASFIAERNSDGSDWSSIIRKTILRTTESKKFILALYHSDLKDHLTRILKDCAQRLVRAIMADEKAEVSLKESDKAFLISFVANGLTGVAMDWFEGGMMEDPEDLARQVVELCSDQFLVLLSKFSRNS